MGYIDSGSKSSRLLASRRYTHNTLTAAQESFTDVLDLGSGEIYTQADYIPSSGLPFSGSTQLNSTYSSASKDILKYWYRQKLTKSNVNNEVWFFLNPTGSSDGVGAQLINDNQVTNFISPKYSVSSLATSTTEDTTPGYLATLFKSSDVSQSAQTSSLSSDDIVSTNDYQFDYKTGIVQFLNASVDPSDTEYIFMTVNQYTGKTLQSGLDITGNVEVLGNVSGSATSTGSFGTLEGDNIGSTLSTLISGSTNAGTVSGSWQGVIGSGSLGMVSGSSISTGSFGYLNVGGNAKVEGILIAQEFHTEFVSGSILYTSGSTKFGDTGDDVHSFTGSLVISGSQTSIDVRANITGSSTSTGSFGSLRVASPQTLTIETRVL